MADRWETPEELFTDINGISDFYCPTDGKIEPLDLEVDLCVSKPPPLQTKKNHFDECPVEYRDLLPDSNEELPVARPRGSVRLDITAIERDSESIRNQLRLANLADEEECSVNYYKSARQVNNWASRKAKGLTPVKDVISPVVDIQPPVREEEKPLTQPVVEAVEGTKTSRKCRNVALTSIQRLKSKEADSGTAVSHLKRTEVRFLPSKVPPKSKDTYTPIKTTSNVAARPDLISDAFVEMRWRGKSEFELARERSRSQKDTFDINGVDFPPLG